MMEYSKKVICEKLIKDGVQLLNALQGYSQADILRKLEILDKKISAASLSNILADRNTGINTLKKASEGIKQIIDKELAYYFDESQLTFLKKIRTDDWEPHIIAPPDLEKVKEKIIIHPDGRWPIDRKVEFMNKAHEEVIEIGVRLNTFSTYFINRNEREFKIPLYTLLEKGVNFSAYLIDPTCNEALLYFNDRGRVQEDEKYAIEKLHSIIKQLLKIQEEINALKFKGHFRIWTYKHIPYNHFFIVDGERKRGKMTISPYIYGVTRANCPVLEFSKEANRSLFRRYYQSYKHLTKNARIIEGYKFL